MYGFVAIDDLSIGRWNGGDDDADESVAVDVRVVLDELKLLRIRALHAVRLV